MFAYIIIGVELAILHFVFWVVFIREPKPREVRAELWGSYANECDAQVDSNQPELPIFVHFDQEKLNPYLPSRARISSPNIVYRRAYSDKLRRRRHRRSNSRVSCACLCHEVKHSANSFHGWCTQVRGDERLANPRLVERFLFVLSRALNNLSVKVP